jgi:chemotaxis protein MotB
VRYSGVIEVDGLPTRPKLKKAAHIDPEDASATPTSDEQDHKREHGAHLKNDQAFALAAASLRQALQDMPELAEASKHIMVEERPKRGSTSIWSTRRAVRCFRRAPRSPTSAPAASSRSWRAAQGHALSCLDTSASKVPPKADYGPWNLSADRANSVRQILEEEGFPPGNIYEVAGRADTDPLFPEDPYIAANRRITITLMHEAPPVPHRVAAVGLVRPVKNVARQPSECFGGACNSSVS